jgi:FkbM family methyltransferase
MWKDFILPRMFATLRSHGFTLKNAMSVLRGVDGARREVFRACVFLLSRKLTPLVGVEDGDVRYVLSTRESTGVCYPTFVRGYFDEQTVLGMEVALAQHVGIATIEGMRVLEIGANIGTETVSLLMRHGVKRVVAIEPDAENVRFLRANLALNGVQDRVAIYEMALSDADGTVVLERSRDNWGDHRVRVGGAFGPDLHYEGLRTTTEVTARRLDSLVDVGEVDLDEIDLVWMDAQGHEGHILSGAERLLAARVPIVTEYWPYGLARVGALERFHALVARHYRAVVDLREPTVALAAQDIAELAQRYTAEASADAPASYTDLLLISR